MKDYTKVREIIEKYITENYSETIIEYQNVPLINDDPAEYISIYDEQIENDNYYTGLLIIRIYTKIGIGTQRSKEIATALSTLIEKKEIEGIIFEDGCLRNVPETANDNYYQQDLSFTFWDENGIENC
jgi:disulfide oxidoreductase YuzD